MDFDEAKAALGQAIVSDGGEEFNGDLREPVAAEPAPVVPEPTEPVAPESSTVEPGSTPEGESFHGLDIKNLPEGPIRDYAEQVERRMQAGLTPKLQEAAAWRKLGEQLGVQSPEEVAQQVQMVNLLNSDPAYARAFYENLGAQLQQAGLVQPVTPQQEVYDPTTEYGGLEYEEQVTDPRLTQQLTALQQEVAAQRQWQEQQQSQWQDQQLALQMQRQESMIRQANPAYKDEDMETIYDLSLKYGGDLEAAANTYAGMQARILSEYIAGKQTVADTTPAPIAGGVPAEVPTGFGTDLEAAHKAAVQALQNHLGQDG